MPISSDFHGTIEVPLICPIAGSIIFCDPAVVQQDYSSSFVATLRANGGGSAWVPTKSIYSGNFDEIVEPQQGTNASAYLALDRASVTNNELQTICPLFSAAAGFNGHAMTLYNPLTMALIKDAFTHDGPGQPSRLDLTSICA